MVIKMEMRKLNIKNHIFCEWTVQLLPLRMNNTRILLAAGMIEWTCKMACSTHYSAAFELNFT